MTAKVVDLEKRRSGPVTDFWFAQLEARLGRIELTVARVERQLWLVVVSALALTGFEVIRLIAG